MKCNYKDRSYLNLSKQALLVIHNQLHLGKITLSVARDNLQFLT